MRVFRFEVAERDGRPGVASVRAPDVEAAARQLQDRGVAPLAVLTADRPEAKDGRRGGGMPAERLGRLARELSTMLSAGLQLDRALAVVARSDGLRDLADTLRGVLEDVRGGDSLSAALESRPDLVPHFAIGMIRAGEAAGALALVLARLADLSERRARSQRMIRSALTYPAILVVTSALSVAGLFTVVLPQLEPLFAGEEEKLPAVTLAVLAVAKAFREYGAAALLVLLAGGLALRVAMASASSRRSLDAFALRLPFVGSFIRHVEAGRFARLLSTTLSSGVPLLRAVELSTAAVSNAPMVERLEAIRAGLGRGEALGPHLGEGGLFPPTLVDLARVGEETGRLAELLAQAAEVMETEAEAKAERAIALLGPSVTILLGGVIALVIASVVLAILSVNSIAA